MNNLKLFGFYLFGFIFIIIHTITLSLYGEAFSGSDTWFYFYSASDLANGLTVPSGKYTFQLYYNYIINYFFNDPYLTGFFIRVLNFTFFYFWLSKTFYCTVEKYNDNNKCFLFFIITFFLGLALSIYNLRDIFVLVGVMIIITNNHNLIKVFGMVLIYLCRPEIILVFIFSYVIFYSYLLLAYKFNFNRPLLYFLMIIILAIPIIDVIPISQNMKSVVASRLLVVEESDINEFNQSSLNVYTTINSGGKLYPIIYERLLPRIPSLIYRSNPFRFLINDLGLDSEYTPSLTRTISSSILNFIGRIVYTFIFIPVLLAVLIKKESNLNNNKYIYYSLVFFVFVSFIYVIRFGGIQDRIVFPLIIPVIYYYLFSSRFKCDYKFLVLISSLLFIMSSLYMLK